MKNQKAKKEEKGRKKGGGKKEKGFALLNYLAQDECNSIRKEVMIAFITRENRISTHF